MKRSERRTHKKKKKIWITLLILFILIGGATFFWYTQFRAGQSLAGEKPDTNEKDIFNAPEPQYGEINILLLGSDARPDENDGRSDSLMIAHYNQDTKELKTVSVMRDIYVDIPGHGKHKMNAAYSIGGPELVRQTIKENFGIDIHYYAEINFDGFPKMVDVVAPDGIEVDIPYKMSHGINMTLEPGVQRLHGKELLGYVRFRHDSKSDFGRVERQQEALAKLKEEAVSLHSFLSLPKLLGMADSYVYTNLDKKTMLSIGKGLLDNKDAGIQSMRIPIDGSFNEDQRIPGVGQVLTIDFEENAQALNDFLSSDSTKSVEDTEESPQDPIIE
ncbi:LCP family protein [Sporosarcina aquimarina]|uniref:Regulatory protein MsrR n=1 Tax=Sporosarcina aquimarina TaxID=114975 RepID=A0ABU4G4J6_9BACL|nr:LCP family protein [Sporosarcina aquimarina]MDW0111280.1 LCP family protein [Sporosarcina aquimarina]